MSRWEEILFPRVRTQVELEVVVVLIRFQSVHTRGLLFPEAMRQFGYRMQRPIDNRTTFHTRTDHLIAKLPEAVDQLSEDRFGEVERR